jgi:hypothetical protein
VFWLISVYFNIRNTLPKFYPFLLGQPVYRGLWRGLGGEEGIFRLQREILTFKGPVA